jgi:hypothetical protein
MRDVVFLGDVVELASLNRPSAGHHLQFSDRVAFRTLQPFLPVAQSCVMHKHAEQALCPVLERSVADDHCTQWLKRMSL